MRQFSIIAVLRCALLCSGRLSTLRGVQACPRYSFSSLHACGVPPRQVHPECTIASCVSASYLLSHDAVLLYFFLCAVADKHGVLFYGNGTLATLQRITLAVVDSTEQIIVAAEVTSEANDKQQAVLMAQAALDNLNAAGIERLQGADGKLVPIPNTADSGYFSEKAVEGTEKIGMDPHFAVSRQKHHEAPIPPPATVLSAQAAAKEKMQQKLCSATGKALYAARKHIVEPVFGQIKSARGVRKFLLRGLEKVSAEWQLICLTHNLLKIWRRSNSAGVG